MIDELIKDIRHDYKKGGGDQRFSFLAVSSGVVCLYSLVRPTPYVSGTVLDRYDCLQLVEPIFFSSRSPPKVGGIGKELDKDE